MTVGGSGNGGHETAAPRRTRRHSDRVVISKADELLDLASTLRRQADSLHAEADSLARTALTLRDAVYGSRDARPST